MNFWDNFLWFSIPTLVCWVISFVISVFYKESKLALIFSIAGLLIFASFIGLLWVTLERPPMRTMGETRLWYSFFLISVGLVTSKKWRYDWLLTYSLVLAMVFVVINIFKPEIHSKNLMPALQSIWFVPHVTAYMVSYAILGAATLVAVKQLLSKTNNEKHLELTDNLVYVGFGLLMLGMLMGAVWAKAAWGHYWSWDPKETWAFVTAATYLFYIHVRLVYDLRKLSLWSLIFAFIFLMITWKGVNYLPSAKNSVHVYSQQ